MSERAAEAAIAAPGERRRAVVAMSGGVDSSLAAALVCEAGYQAVGISMNLAGGGSRCCSSADVEDARRVAHGLGMRFFVVNYAQRFEGEVIEPFVEAYLRGETPIPCIACNTRFKFDYLLERARVLGAEKLATGHYARIDRDPRSGRYRLLRARDRAKDQTYFLFQLGQAQLARLWFPLGELEKKQVRARARAMGLATADKAESQEICFVPDGDYKHLIEARRPQAALTTGEIVDSTGRVLGTHSGVHRFTVGQRHGLGVAAGRALYVLRIENETQRVVVGDLSETACESARVDAVSWVSGEPTRGPLRVCARVRHRHQCVAAEVVALGDESVRLRFLQPVRSVAPGQAAVFYDAEHAETVLGGGFIRATQARGRYEGA